MSHHQKPVKPQLPKNRIRVCTGPPSDDVSQAFTESAPRQPFISQLDILLGSSTDSPSKLPMLPEELKTLMLCHTFQYATLNMASLLQTNFMHTYIRSGSLVALSCRDPQGDVIAIDGSGRLVLSLTKDTYELLGIVGTPSRFGAKRQRYFAEFDLRQDCMRDHKAGYERLKACLNRLGNVCMMFSFVNSKGQFLPVRFPDGITPKTLRTKLEIRNTTFPRSCNDSLISLYESISRPNISKKRERDSQQTEDSAVQLLDDIGLAATCAGERQATTSIEGITCTWTGLLHPKLVSMVYIKLGTHYATHLSVITAHTFPHSPVEASRVTRAADAKHSKVGRDERDVESPRNSGCSLVSGGPAIGQACPAMFAIN